jgi:hypothetical protein
MGKRIIYNDGTISIVNSLTSAATDIKPGFYTLNTLQWLLGEQEGLKYYIKQNNKYHINIVETLN